MRVLTSHEMSKVDRAAMELGIRSLELMEQAGRNTAKVALDILTEHGGTNVCVVTGKGNNAGDGFVAARILANRGISVSVYALATEELSGDARKNFERLENVEMKSVKDEVELSGMTEELGKYDLIIDAIFGTGFKGSPSGAYAQMIDAINLSGVPVLSVDIPSGVDGMNGTVPGKAVKATRTVTFQALKVGLVQYPGAAYAGHVEVVDIGIPPEVLDDVPTSRIYTVEEDEVESLLPDRDPWVHKRECGSVLVVGGSRGLTGAAALCARAALRAGAGLVTLCIPETLNSIMEVKLTEVMTKPLRDDGEGRFKLEAAGEILEICDGYDVLALGPGLSTSGKVPEMVREVIKGAKIPLVLDADGLNAISGCADILEMRKNSTVITPHPGEMGRLLCCTSADVQANRIFAAREGAKKWNVVVVLKGAGTVVAEPGETVMINTTGNPGMATAGTGDVLTGCIAALIGQGLRAFEAAYLGVYIHGKAGDLAASMDAMVGMVAGDVLRYIPLAMRKMQG